MKLLKPKLTALKIKISDKLEEEARELETHIYFSLTQKRPLVCYLKQAVSQLIQSALLNFICMRLKLNDGTPTMSVLRSLQTNGTLKNLIASGKDKVASSLDFNPRQKKQGKYSEINRSLPNIPKMIVTPSNPRDEYSDPISIQRKTASPSPPPIRYSTFKAKQFIFQMNLRIEKRDVQQFALSKGSQSRQITVFFPFVTYNFSVLYFRKLGRKMLSIRDFIPLLFLCKVANAEHRETECQQWRFPRGDYFLQKQSRRGRQHAQNRHAIERGLISQQVQKLRGEILFIGEHKAEVLKWKCFV